MVPSPPRQPNIPHEGNVIQRSDSYSGLRPVGTRRGYHGAARGTWILIETGSINHPDFLP